MRRLVCAILLNGLLGSIVYGQDFFELVNTGTPEQVAEAINAGADINARDENGRTSLMIAASQNKNPKITFMLLKAGAAVNGRAGGVVYSGKTPLMLAALSNENPEVISVLLKAGADINTRDESGMNSLMSAAGSNENPDVISVLLKAGADLNARTENGTTALMLAAYLNRNVDIVFALLKAGAEVNAKDANGKTVLMSAAQYISSWYDSNPAVISVLLKAGADGKLRDSTGKTAFDYAKDNPKLQDTKQYWELNDARFSAPIIPNPNVYSVKEANGSTLQIEMERSSDKAKPNWRSEIILPKNIIDEKLKPFVVISFVVDKNGFLSAEPVIQESSGYAELDEAVKRAMINGRWKFSNPTGSDPARGILIYKVNQ